MQDPKYKKWMRAFEYLDEDGLLYYKLTWPRIRQMLNEHVQWLEENGRIRCLK